MPKVSNVGIIPVRWQGADLGPLGLNAFRLHVEESFPRTVRASHRFRVLNDDLVGSLWSSPDGRAELVRDYELQGFMNLLATVDGDVVRLQMRLLGPAMQIYLLEEQALGLSWISGATTKMLDEKISDLTFRMLNRLPIDVTVLATQGRYITLSGGKAQGLRLGDELTIVRPAVSQVHPANGAWVEFQKQKMGSARVVDINEITAIAKLTEQSYEDAVSVGDGAKIYNIAGRVRFARLGQDQELIDHGSPAKLASAPPAAPEKKTVDEKTAEPKAGPPVRQAKEERRPLPPENDSSPPAEQEQYEEQPYPYEQNDGEPTLVGEFLKVFRGVDMHTGLDSWNVSGGASASSTLAPWMLNYFAGSMRAPFAPNIDMEAGGALHLGQTKNGSYTGFDLGSKFVYLIPTDGVISFYRVGGLGRFESRNIQSEGFGGGDYILLGGLAGVEGRVRYAAIPLEWHAEMALIPLGIGQLGFDGSKKSLAGVFGYEFEIGVIKPSESSLDLGGTIGLSSIDMDAGESFTRSSTKLLLHARYKF